ncbi:ABC transporter permease [Kallotenue papyrolyticum]|uniref:ABC transporter permease n=1 Tax=Kallotenue papyrolyticum TaxID=1325125 RepID=UPI0004729900|nr:ABC transporter permease [Kallotenue papyrolyticum]
MKLGDMAAMAVSNLGRRKVRTTLTSFGVVVGILTIVTMVSLGIGVRREINRQFDVIGLERVFVRPREGERGFFTQFAAPQRARPITPADVERWRALPEVVAITADVELPPGMASLLRVGAATTAVQVQGSDTFQAPFVRPPTALAGTIELPDEPGKLILNADALRGLGLSPARAAELIGQPAEIVLRQPRGEEQRFQFTIIGVSSEALGLPGVRVPLPDRVAMKSWWFNRPNLLATDGYDLVTLRARDIAAANALVATLRREGLRVQSLETILDLANQIFTVINVMLSSVGGLALLVAALGIINTMIMSIYERTREIGTLKAIGASRGDIRWLFMLEAGLIGLLGGVIGVVGGWSLGRLLNRAILWYIEREQLPIRGDFFVVTPGLALYALVFAVLIGIVAGLYPANRAARLDPLLALRHE